MALTALEKDFISNSGNAAKILLDLYSPLLQIDSFWAGTPGFTSSITQADIDSVTSFAGLTTGYLADAQTALANVKTAIANALVALSVVGNLP